jgi:hypothetical protein
MHGTSFAFTTIFTNVFQTVFKSASTDVSGSVCGSPTNRVHAGACRVKDGYQPHSCLAVSPSGKASRHLRGTTPRAPGRYSVTFCMNGTTGTISAASNRTVSSVRRLRRWLDERYVDGDDGRYGLGSLHRHGSDAGSSPSGSRPCLPAKLRHACSPVQPCPISHSAANFGGGSQS